MRDARSHFAYAACQEKIYIFGGGGRDFKSLNSVEIYDPREDKWSTGNDMPTIRSGNVAVTLNNKIYVLGGGVKGSDGKFRYLKTVEIYSPSSDTWEKGPDLLMPHDYPAVAVYNNRIYLFGGHHPEIKSGYATDPGFSFCEVLDESKERWIECNPLPTSRFALSAVILNGKIMAIGGAGFNGETFTNYRAAESYDPISGRWRDEKDMILPWRAAGLGACNFNGKLYIFGGNSGDKIESRAACYDVHLKRWKELTPMNEPRIVMGVVA
ncbi:MAG: Kelch repeat-containing protein, partial [Nitrospirota bacterium]